MNLARMALSIVYPAVCPICSKIVTGTQGQSRPCGDCQEKLLYVGEARCLKCGKSLRGDGEIITNENFINVGDTCSDCSRKRHIYDQGAAVFEYTEEIKNSIYSYKYDGCRDFADWYGEEMYDRLRIQLDMWRPDVIMPVPLHKKKQRERGFNQAQLIAKRLSELSGIPMDAESLVRSRATVPMKSLDDIQRAENIKKAFTIASNTLKYKKVLLIDDIYTTGSTVDECASVLKKAGVARVYYAALCIGRGI